MPNLKIAAALALAIAALASPATAQVPTVSASEIRAETAEREVMTVAATGVQIYECRSEGDGRLAWTFTGPRADLTLSGKVIGKHYAGPHWELPDGSIVKATPVARAEAPGAGSIPWLRLKVTESRGKGQLTGVTAVLRTNTSGGALTGACTEAGKRQEQPYTSDYVFLRSGS